MSEFAIKETLRHAKDSLANCTLRFGDADQLRWLAMVAIGEKLKDVDLECQCCDGTGEVSCNSSCCGGHECKTCSGYGEVRYEQRQLDRMTLEELQEAKKAADEMKELLCD